MESVVAMPLDERLTRHWLANLHRPDRLDGPVMRALLRAHGIEANGTPLDVGRRGAELLRRKIDQLQPPEGSAASERLPHRVLKACFVDGSKSFQAAPRLGLSERQMSRERSRAISLLTAELRVVPRTRGAAPPARRTVELVPRGDAVARLRALLERWRRVHVHGAPGCGKTSLLSLHAAASERAVFWVDLAPGVNAELWSLLFELGEHLEPDDASLAGYLRSALPHPDSGLATRIALSALGRGERLLVLDGYDAAADPTIEAFVREAAARLPLLRVVTAGSAGVRDVSFRVPAFDVDETRALLELRGAPASLGPELWAWTRGHPRLTDVAATWLGDPARSAPLHALRGDRWLGGACARSLARPAGSTEAATRSSARSRRGSTRACR